MGERTADQKRWRWFDVVVDGARPVAQAEEIGGVLVDEARVLFADLDALGGWQHDAALDGKADVAFWGKDADAVAARFGANRLPEGVWGWADLPVADAEARMRALLAAREEGSTFLPDFRPHSHLYAGMALVRAHPYGVGAVVVDGAVCCLAMTSWGDGVFPVLALRDAGGALLGVRVVFGGASLAEAGAVGQALGGTAAGLPDPRAATQAAMAGAATQLAQNAARRAVMGQVKAVVPKVLWPLLPGEGGTVGGNLEAMARRRMWALVGSVAFLLVGLAIAGAVLVATALLVAGAVLVGGR